MLVEHRRMGQGSVHTTMLGEGFAISIGNLFDCDALGVEMKRGGTGGSVRAYHGENEKIAAAKETMDDDGWSVYIGSRGAWWLLQRRSRFN
jgi:hypothetical protein